LLYVIKKGHASTANNYANQLCKGTFGFEKIKEVEQYFLRAIKKGHSHASYNYAIEHYHGTFELDAFNHGDSDAAYIFANQLLKGTFAEKEISTVKMSAFFKLIFLNLLLFFIVF
jgi:TPR repeat protein